ncbi:N-acetyltransferase [Pseudomonas sp. SWRI92]|uniref:N-acetyltransferase n=1 Tax=Pseudomonas marvdashtae TaxID=2745500 RepID=A0A923FKA4_9PSED|nr:MULTISPECIES: N-acetyltransferase [Pseudomonas]MBC3375109.1 N-acetyltransferase [Pseudomonas sp. SWRI92]MBV4551150.1 N-acetyltransferase [Pseudomonas marvdashtae]
MNALQTLRDRIQKKGLRAVLKQLCRRYVFAHTRLVWLEHDIRTPLPPHNLKPYPPMRLEFITIANADAFARHFGDRVETMRELAAEGYTGLMYLDDRGDTVGFAWASTRDYFDRHFYRCNFPVKPGEYFQFGGEAIRKYWGTSISADMQLEVWKVMAEHGCSTMVDVCDLQNIQAIKMHIRMGFQERGQITHLYRLLGHWRFLRNTSYTGTALDAFRKPAQPAASTSAA